tara:strand:- start:1670 stop:2620 length:951 start_codon:yes stop_codon:yes gene_type:complete
MISFIVIGKNEERNLFKCISSINETIKINKIVDCEIIYIDSDSTDYSIEIIKSFKNVMAFKIKGDINAALARNVGAKKSIGDILFFIDGDMELIPENFKQYYENGKLIGGEYIAGNFYHCLYHDNTLISKELYSTVTKDSNKTLAGGMFLINRDLWFKNNGMRTCFRRSQDYDLAMRMAKSGNKILLRSTPLALHHTIDYNYFGRFTKDLFTGNFFYQILLIKYNLFNKYIIPEVMREITLMILILSMALVYISSNTIYLSLYLFSILLKLIYKKRIKEIVKYLYIYIALDICGFLSFFIFWPKSVKRKNYQIIRA